MMRHLWSSKLLSVNLCFRSGRVHKAIVPGSDVPKRQECLNEHVVFGRDYCVTTSSRVIDVKQHFLRLAR